MKAINYDGAVSLMLHVQDAALRHSGTPVQRLPGDAVPVDVSGPLHLPPVRHLADGPVDSRPLHRRLVSAGRQTTVYRSQDVPADDGHRHRIGGIQRAALLGIHSQV